MAREDRTSLGEILVEMGIITHEQLDKAIDYQENSSLEQKLGAILHHMGFCTGEDVETALSIQSSMRAAKNSAQKAMVAADIAIQRRKSNGERDRAIRCAEMLRTPTGSEYPVVTAEMLAKSRG